MDKHVLFVLFISCTIVASSPPNVYKQYRTDYVYNHKTDAFYKLHTESRQGWQAMKICEIEGSKLLEPTTQEDKEQLLEMLGRFPSLAEYVWIGHNETSDPSLEYDLSSSAITPMDWEFTSCYAQGLWMDVVQKNCSDKLPFICKVEASAAPYDDRCDSFGTNYRYVPRVGSCYKIPRIAYPWPIAYAECRAEGGHLLVLNSEEERLVVKEITSRTPRVVWSQNRDYLLTGYREVKKNGVFQRVFKTIFNETMKEAGFNEWGLTEPNGWNENCGCVYIEDSLPADISCIHNFGFICEKEIPSNRTRAPPAEQDLPISSSTFRVKNYTYIQTVLSVDLK